MSLLESYRKFYHAEAERKLHPQHKFRWIIKKTETDDEECLDYPIGFMSIHGALRTEATKFLIEGIEEWLNPIKVPEVRTYGRWFWTRPGYGL